MSLLQYRSREGSGGRLERHARRIAAATRRSAFTTIARPVATAVASVARVGVLQGIVRLTEQGRMKELLSRIATDKDEAAFRELFEAYRPRLRSFMLRSGANPATAEELVQEAMLAVVMLPAAFWLGRSWVEVALLAGSVLLVLIVELLNSAIEATVDRISFDLHELSKRAKDFGSAAVLLALLLAGGVWTAALFQRFLA